MPVKVTNLIRRTRIRALQILLPLLMLPLHHRIMALILNSHLLRAWISIHKMTHHSLKDQCLAWKRNPNKLRRRNLRCLIRENIKTIMDLEVIDRMTLLSVFWVAVVMVAPVVCTDATIIRDRSHRVSVSISRRLTRRLLILMMYLAVRKNWSLGHLVLAIRLTKIVIVLEALSQALTVSNFCRQRKSQISLDYISFQKFLATTRSSGPPTIWKTANRS